MRMPEKCRNNGKSDNPLTSRRTDGGKKTGMQLATWVCQAIYLPSYLSEAVFVALDGLIVIDWSAERLNSYCFWKSVHWLVYLSFFPARLVWMHT